MKCALGIDIGGTTIKYSLVSTEGKLFAKYSIGVSPNKKQEDTLQDIFASIEDNIEMENPDIVGIGIGCPGGINPWRGTCDYATNLGWKNFAITEATSKKFGLPCFIENDANVALLGEIYFGIAKNYKDVVFLTLGTGVGSGLYLDGKIYSGNEGKGAELGHSIIEHNGRLCGCGRRGCLECYASASALSKDAALAMAHHPESMMWQLCSNPNRMNGAVVFAAEKAGDPVAKEVIDNYISYLGDGCLDFCNIFRPQAILLGGGVAKQGEYLRSKLQRYIEKNGYGLLKVNPPKTEILIASLGSDAGIYGAGALCFENLKAE